MGYNRSHLGARGMHVYIVVVGLKSCKSHTMHNSAWVIGPLAKRVYIAPIQNRV